MIEKTAPTPGSVRTGFGVGALVSHGFGARMRQRLSHGLWCSFVWAGETAVCNAGGLAGGGGCVAVTSGSCARSEGLRCAGWVSRFLPRDCNRAVAVSRWQVGRSGVRDARVLGFGWA